MNPDEKECPDCAEIIKRNAKVCRYCGYRFGESDMEEAPDAAEPTVAEPIDEAIMTAMPFYAKRFRDQPILYHAGQRKMTVTRGRLDELATATQYPLEQLRDRFVSLGWVYAETDEEAEEIAEERARKHEETMARLNAINRAHGVDNQYGVLQPIANLAGGCFTAWQWVILIFLLVLIVVAVKSVFE